MYKPERYRSAGIVSSLTEGTPEAQQSGGVYDFRANVLFVGVEPFIANLEANTSSTFLRTINARVSGVSADKGAQISVTVSAEDRRRIAAARGGITGAILDSPVGSLVDASVGSIQVPAWWVTVRGRFDSSLGFAMANLQGAVAGALSNSTTFAVRNNGYVAPDGPTILAAFRRPNACSGAVDYASSVGAACVRPVRVGATVTTQPGAPIASTAQRTVLPRHAFWLRPSATFDRVGPQFPAGTPIVLLDIASTGSPPRAMQQGGLVLYRVRTLAGAEGYAALADDDVIDSPGHYTTPTQTVSRPTQAPTPIAGLRGPTHDKFWLRTWETFAHATPEGVPFPMYPAGTIVEVRAAMPITRRGLRLYRVRVVEDQREGYAAFSTADIAGMRSYAGIILRNYGVSQDTGEP